MARFHWLRLRATAHATEDPDLVQEAIRVATGLDPERLARLVQRTVLESHHGGAVVLVEATVQRAAEVRDVFGRLAAPDAARLADEADARTDEDGVFHLRVEKQAALAGKLVLTSGGDAIVVRVKPEVHPAGRERAIAAVRAFLETKAQ